LTIIPEAWHAPSARPAGSRVPDAPGAMGEPAPPQKQLPISTWSTTWMSTSPRTCASSPLLIQGLSIGYDVAVGSRLLPASQTKRSFKREALSRSYNRLVKLMFSNRFSDAQCGFKALRREVAHRLLPHVESTSWFFDTEMLLLAETWGYKIFEVPVEWTEDQDTRLKIIPTAIEDLRGLIRMRLAGFGRIPRRGSPAQEATAWRCPS
jgi:hypothetical protein